MVNNPFNQRFDELRQALAALTPEQSVIFALDCARQVLPIYDAWGATEPWAKPATLHEAVALIEAVTQGQNVAADDLREMSERVQECTPHSEDFPNVVGAIDAGICVWSAVDCARTKAFEAVCAASEYAIIAHDIVAAHHDKSLSSDDAHRDLTPAGLREWQRQLEAITALRSL